MPTGQLNPHAPLLSLCSRAGEAQALGEARRLKPPALGTTLNICMSHFTTGRPGEEHGTNKPPPTGRGQERSKGDTPGSSLASILAEQDVHHQEGF